MSLKHFILGILGAGSLCAGLMLSPNDLTAQSDKVKTSMAALQSETSKLGAPKVQGNDLYFGTTKASNDLVDAVVKANGGAASLFVKSGDQYVRVATTLKKDDGTSAVGTTMDPKSPAMAKLNSGEAYYGEGPVLGKTYDTGYEPIKDASGVIGAYFVGYASIPNEAVIPNEVAFCHRKCGTGCGPDPAGGIPCCAKAC